MSTIVREIEVGGAPDDVGATWPHFIHWILTGHSRLVCGELACVSAVDSGNVSFEPVDEGRRTRVVFRLDVDPGEPGPGRDELERHVTHDLLVFRDYIERGGIELGNPSHAEVVAAHVSHGRKVDDATHESAESGDRAKRLPHTFP